jgi:hypothetical protein
MTQRQPWGYQCKTLLAGEAACIGQQEGGKKRGTRLRSNRGHRRTHCTNAGNQEKVASQIYDQTKYAEEK